MKIILVDREKLVEGGFLKEGSIWEKVKRKENVRWVWEIMRLIWKNENVEIE